MVARMRWLRGVDWNFAGCGAGCGFTVTAGAVPLVVIIDNL
jgi:hypothetical protein